MNWNNERHESTRRTEDGAETVAVSDLFSSVRRYSTHSPRTRWRSSTERLLLAVLMDAIRCFQAPRSAASSRHEHLRSEARQWLFQKSGRGPFSFEAVCEALDLEPNQLRRGLIKWRDANTSEQREAVIRGRLASPRRSYPVIRLGGG